MLPVTRRASAAWLYGNSSAGIQPPYIDVHSDLVADSASRPQRVCVLWISKEHAGGGARGIPTEFVFAHMLRGDYDDENRFN